MFYTQTYVFVSVLAALFCAATVFGATESIIKAHFVERKGDQPGAYTEGDLYYYYNPNDVNSSRLRFEYSSLNIANLYHYKDNAIYSMCSDACTGLSITEKPDPWYNVGTSVYTKGSQEGNYYWFTRKAITGAFSAQVSRILMSDTSSATADIKIIEFRDGRTLTLSNVKLNPSDVPKSSTKFTTNRNDCPKPTCPIYADLIFVLDNSNSVSDTSWRKGGNFVDAVMQSFTFGIDAVEAAIIHFNAPPAYMCTQATVDGCKQCINDYGFITTLNGEPVTFPGWATAEIIAGRDYGSGLSVSDDRIALETVMNSSRPKRSGQTCQGYGLELAMKALDRSPRRKYSKKPQPIVIAVTDGADWCPNRTADATKKLRNDYDAFVIEIGVGMYSGCNDYDKNFLRRIASKVGSSDTPAYYDVSDYGAIHKVTEQLFKPICDGYNTQCGPDCHGFCGCGKCLCPTCDIAQSSCEKTSCSADGTSSTGCVNNTIPCPIKDDVCTKYKCNPAKYGDDRCYAVVEQCTTLKEQNKNYACREVKCDVLMGGCRVSKYDDNYCQSKYGNKCLQYECARSNSGDTIGTSGCRLSLNRTLQKETELKNSGKNACAIAVCTPSVGVSEKDLCPSKLNSTVCYDSSCTLINKKYQCKDVAIHRPAETNCTKYECKSTGWVKKAKYSEADCRKEFLDSGKYEDEKGLRCINAFCSDDNGHRCYDKPITGCSTKCDPENNTKCKNEGYQASNLEKCYAGSCDYIKVSNEWQQMCIPLDSAGNLPSNCLNNDTLMQAAKNRNEKNKNECCTVACTIDGCDIVCEDRPASLNNKCLEHKCVFVHAAGYAANRGTWKWDIVASEVNSTCKTDECYKRRCDPTDGCIEVEEICLSRNTECFTYNCIKETGKCNETNHLVRNTTCTRDECVNGNITLVQNLDGCVRLKTDKCVSAECVYESEGEGKRGSSWCNYTKIPDPTNNPCIDYECYTEDGIAKWTNKPHCYDGLYCTEDVCTVFGECKFKQVKCSDELDMEGYPCFEARCIEKPENSTYKCVRKLIKNAYIDVCGNCIVEKEESEENSDSSASSSEEEVDLLECTGAPPKPLLTEGLAAATVALIVIGAVVIGSGIAASGVMGTKTLIARAKAANNQSAHTNPLFQDNEAEMSNPAFIETEE